MADSGEILRSIEENILSPDPGRIRRAVARLKKGEAPPREALAALTRGMERARRRFQEKQIPLPDLLLSVDAFRDGLRTIQPLLESARRAPAAHASVVIGVVEGDVHDLGKNIVAGILEVSGYRVLDLGRDVKRDDFLEAVQAEKPAVLALSSMMSTPLDNMREVVRWARRLHPEVRVLVGGAALDEALAAKLGADGYAEDAGRVTEEVRRLLGAAARPVAPPLPAPSL